MCGGCPPDHFATLGIRRSDMSKEQDKNEMRVRFRQLMMVLHPDRRPASAGPSRGSAAI
eukprot:gene47716-47963_t